METFVLLKNNLKIELCRMLWYGMLWRMLCYAIVCVVKGLSWLYKLIIISNLCFETCYNLFSDHLKLTLILYLCTWTNCVKNVIIVINITWIYISKKNLACPVLTHIRTFLIRNNFYVILQLSHLMHKESKNDWGNSIYIWLDIRTGD